MQAPKYQAPPPDPTVTALQERATTDNLTALQNTARINTSELMSRYGTRLAIAGAGTGASPLITAGRV